MKRHILISVILAVAFSLLTWLASVTTAGSSFGHKVNAGCFTLVAAGLIIGAAIATAQTWHRKTATRYYSALLFALACMLLIGTTWHRAYQNSFVIGQLESAYDSIVNNGTPFPTEAQVRQKYLESVPDSFSTGYWVSPDRQSFEIYYHDSSDS